MATILKSVYIFRIKGRLDYKLLKIVNSVLFFFFLIDASVLPSPLIALKRYGGASMSKCPGAGLLRPRWWSKV